MTTMVCRAVAQAGRVAATASLDDERPEQLLLVAGWQTTAADLMMDAVLTGSLDAEPMPPTPAPRG